MDNNELDEEGNAKKDRKDKSKFKSSSYKCQFCDKSFPRLGYLKKHEQVSAEIMILFLVIIIAAVPKLVQLLNIPMWRRESMVNWSKMLYIYMWRQQINFPFIPSHILWAPRTSPLSNPSHDSSDKSWRWFDPKLYMRCDTIFPPSFIILTAVKHKYDDCIKVNTKWITFYDPFDTCSLSS